VVSYVLISGQGLVVSLLWSGVGGQLLSHQIAVVRGWWSAIVSACWWLILFFRRTLSRSFRENGNFCEGRTARSLELSGKRKFL